jgi:hypothetical protein
MRDGHCLRFFLVAILTQFVLNTRKKWKSSGRTSKSCATKRLRDLLLNPKTWARIWVIDYGKAHQRAQGYLENIDQNKMIMGAIKHGFLPQNVKLTKAQYGDFDSLLISLSMAWRWKPPWEEEAPMDLDRHRHSMASTNNNPPPMDHRGCLYFLFCSILSLKRPFFSSSLMFYAC